MTNLRVLLFSLMDDRDNIDDSDIDHSGDTDDSDDIERDLEMKLEFLAMMNVSLIMDMMRETD